MVELKTGEVERLFYNQVKRELIFQDSRTTLFERINGIVGIDQRGKAKFKTEALAFLKEEAAGSTEFKASVSDAIIHEFNEKSSNIYETILRLETIINGKRFMEFSINGQAEYLLKNCISKCDFRVKNAIKYNSPEYGKFILGLNNREVNNVKVKNERFKSMFIPVLDQAKTDVIATLNKTTNPNYIISFAEKFKTLDEQSDYLYKLLSRRDEIVNEKSREVKIINGAINRFPKTVQEITNYYEPDPEERTYIVESFSTVPTVAEGKKSPNLEIVK